MIIITLETKVIEWQNHTTKNFYQITLETKVIKEKKYAEAGNDLQI